MTEQGAGATSADLLVLGTIFTNDSEHRIIDNGAVAVAGDRILAIGPAAELAARYPAASRLEQEFGVVMPGLVNVHTHAAMACFRGLADDLPLMTWLQEYIFPVEAKLTGDMVYHSSLLSMAEMIRSGTTSFCDMYLFARDVARAADLAGMRAWIGEVLYDFPSPNYGPLEAGFEYSRGLCTDYGDHPLISCTVDPHAVYTCSPELLVRLKRMAEEFDAPYVIHLSENEEEVRTCVERYGRTPVMHLHELGLLDGRVIADHCVVLTQEEIALLAERRVKVAHCPESNMKLASGVAPVPAMLAAGIDVGLGTDGSASNNDVDMFGEMTSAALIHKVTNLDPILMAAGTVVDMATMGGARVLGAEKLIGSIEVGKKADLIVLDFNQPHLTPLYNIASHLVYAARGGDVVHSVINGRVVMRDRQFTTLDEESIRAEVNDIAVRIKDLVGR